MEDIKQRLATNQLVGFETDLYPGFGEWTGPGVFSSTAAPEEDSYHAMLIVGYDDARGAFRVRNSWGNGWGDGGCIWLSYDTFQKGSFWPLRVSVRRRLWRAPEPCSARRGGPAGQTGTAIPPGPRVVTILARARDGRQLTYTGSVNVPELTGVTPADPPAQEAGSNGQDPP